MIVPIIGVVGLLYFVVYRFLPDEIPMFPIGGYGGSVMIGPSRQLMAMLVSVVVLCAALYVILSNHYGTDTQKWAHGVIGLILGFWLRHESPAASATEK
jgi:hypothetical protein